MSLADLGDNGSNYPDDQGTTPTPQPKQWDPTTFHAPETRSGPAHSNVDHSLPPIPGGSGKGRTVVDTPSLDLFAGNMDKLHEPVQQAYQKLMSLKMVHPGAFYDAYQLRSATSGANGDQGLQAQYLKILEDLGKGLSDLGSGCRHLSAKYSSTEDANKMSATELLTELAQAQGDFGKMGSGG